MDRQFGFIGYIHLVHLGGVQAAYRVNEFLSEDRQELDDVHPFHPLHVAIPFGTQVVQRFESTGGNGRLFAVPDLGKQPEFRAGE